MMKATPPKVGEFAAVKHGYSPKELANKPCPFFVIKLEEDVMTNDPVRRYDCFWLSEDLLPFHFTDSGIENGTVVSEGILEYGIACVDVPGRGND